MIYLLFAILGLLPSVIWLLFYLRKDRHPESNSMVLKVFLWGMMIGPIAILFEFCTRWLMYPLPLADFLNVLAANAKDGYLFANVVFAAPLVEETLKYAVVKFRVLKNPEFDEPLDAMLYMIIAALGFAAIENLLIIFQQTPTELGKAINLTALRFISATFLHALTAGLLGYWLARAIKEPQKKFQLLLRGLVLAILCHTAYNLLVWQIDSQSGTLFSLIPISIIFILLSFMAIAVSYYFSRLKKLHSVCRLCGQKEDKASLLR